jgi:hypothetical protein
MAHHVEAVEVARDAAAAFEQIVAKPEPTPEALRRLASCYEVIAALLRAGAAAGPPARNEAWRAEAARYHSRAEDALRLASDR